MAKPPDGDRDNHRPGITGSQEISDEFARILRIVRPREVRRRAALSRAHLRRLQKQGRFPPYVQVDGHVYGLYEHVLDAFIAVRMEARGDGLPPLGYRPPVADMGVSDPRTFRSCRASTCSVCATSQDLVGFKKSHINRRRKQRRFPDPVSLGERATRWVAHEVQDWLRERDTGPPGPGCGLPYLGPAFALWQCRASGRPVGGALPTSPSVVSQIV